MNSPTAPPATAASRAPRAIPGSGAHHRRFQRRQRGGGGGGHGAGGAGHGHRRLGARAVGAVRPGRLQALAWSRQRCWRVSAVALDRGRGRAGAARGGRAGVHRHPERRRHRRCRGCERCAAHRLARQRAVRHRSRAGHRLRARGGRAAGRRGAAGRRRGRLARARAAGRIERDPAFRSLRGARRARRARARQVRPRSAGTAARLAAGAGARSTCAA